jgi:hypothetical protein
VDFEVVLATYATTFPGVRDRVVAFMAEWYDPHPPGTYVLFNEAIGRPILEPLLESNEVNEEALRSFFEETEALLAGGDSEITNLVKLEVLGRLLSNQNWRERASAFLGPLSASLLESYEVRLNQLGRQQ